MSSTSSNGRASELGNLSPATANPASDDRYAEAVLDARLGREARDVLEATVVLEAWTGRPASAPWATRGVWSALTAQVRAP